MRVMAIMLLFSQETIALWPSHLHKINQSLVDDLFTEVRNSGKCKVLIFCSDGTHIMCELWQRPVRAVQNNQLSCKIHESIRNYIYACTSTFFFLCFWIRPEVHKLNHWGGNFDRGHSPACQEVEMLHQLQGDTVGAVGAAGAAVVEMSFHVLPYKT